MAAELIDGKAIASQIHELTSSKVTQLKSRGIQPHIVFVRVGEDPASQAYVGMKDKMGKQLGLLTTTKIFPENTTEQELLAFIGQLNADQSVHGILVQAPLPSHISETVVFTHVLPVKDVDGFHPMNVGKLLLGDNSGFRPCTPAGVHELLIRSGVKTEGAEVAILGRGNIVGKPMAAILCQKECHANSTVTILHSRSKDIASHTRRADIIIAAMGYPHFLKADMVKPGAVIIDVGVNRIQDSTVPRGYRLVGDVEFEALLPIVSKITPNPGGVGPMTIAMLMANTARAAEFQTT